MSLMFQKSNEHLSTIYNQQTEGPLYPGTWEFGYPHTQALTVIQLICNKETKDEFTTQSVCGLLKNGNSI